MMDEIWLRSQHYCLFNEYWLFGMFFHFFRISSVMGSYKGRSDIDRSNINFSIIENSMEI